MPRCGWFPDIRCTRSWYAYPVRTVRGALWGQAALRLRYVPEAGTRSTYVPIRGPEAHASAQVVAGGSHAECSVEPKEYGLGESLGAPKANALGDGSFRERFPKVARSPESLVLPLAIRHPRSLGPLRRRAILRTYSGAAEVSK